MEMPWQSEMNSSVLDNASALNRTFNDSGNVSGLNRTLTADMPHRTAVETTLVAILLLVIFFLAVSGNLLVVAAVMNNSVLRDQAANVFIINLCISDLSSAIVIMFTSFVALLGDFSYINTIWCNIVCAANYCLIIVSMLTLCCISVERLIAVVHPLQYNNYITFPFLKAICFYSWIQGAAFGLAPVFQQWVHYDYWEAICAIQWHAEHQAAVYYVIVAFIANFGLPGIIMLTCYVSIMHTARKLHLTQVIPSSSDSSTNSNVMMSLSRKAFKTITSLLIVVLFFFICMTPFCVTKLLKVIVEDPKYVPPYANLTASLFQYMSSMINPFIYAIFRKEFRLTFKHIMRRGMYLPCFNGQNLDHGDLRLSISQSGSVHQAHTVRHTVSP